jgi:hypothetical protein
MLPLEYPDKFYSSTSERSSRFFQVLLDAGIEATNLNPRQKRINNRFSRMAAATLPKNNVSPAGSNP